MNGGGKPPTLLTWVVVARGRLRLLVLQVDDVCVALQQMGTPSVCCIVRNKQYGALWLIRNTSGRTESWLQQVDAFVKYHNLRTQGRSRMRVILVQGSQSQIACSSE